jgi:fatty-acyl-CoA synthase
MPDTRSDPAAREGVLAKETALYIYTSGTTGMPKAARITHARALGLMKSFIAPSNITARDRVYLTLPLYHATGGMCGAGAALFSGATIILRRKFSATHFWAEATAERATVFVYIGELCRYLVNLPPSPQETQHSLRTCFGNGLRPDVWTRFTQRTGIKRIVEFYGSTEGNVSMANLDHRPGSVGAIPRFMRNRFPMRIIRFDVEAEAPVRGPDGLCIEAAPGEAGEAVGEIRSDEARFRFEGYSDPAQTEKKVLRNVFAEGDMWFRTGDLMMQDADTYFYFVDRIGDTFRWKGENVSTNEVAEVLTGDPAVPFANVYGVQIPAADGRAGMAALVVNEGFDLASLHTRIQRELPAYARPLFIRIQSDVDATGTLKLKKVELVREGYDLNRITDAVYFNNPEVNGFTALTPEIVLRLERGELRV